MGKRLTGPGGFIDITAATPEGNFAGTLMGKAKVKVGGGKLEIVEEGTIQKFVEKVGQDYLLRTVCTGQSGSTVCDRACSIPADRPQDDSDRDRAWH